MAVSLSVFLQTNQVIITSFSYRKGRFNFFGESIGKYKESELYGKVIGVLPQKCESLFGGNTVREDLEKSLYKSIPEKKKGKSKLKSSHLFVRYLIFSTDTPMT